MTEIVIYIHPHIGPIEYHVYLTDDHDLIGYELDGVQEEDGVIDFICKPLY